MEESISTAPWRYLWKIHIMTQNNITQQSLYTIFINLVKKHWVSIVVRLNSYYFTCFHANLASTYYTYVSNEVKQFVWWKAEPELYPVLTQICLTPKAIGVLRHQIKGQGPFSQSAEGIQMGRKRYLVVGGTSSQALRKKERWNGCLKNVLVLIMWR